MRRAVPNPRRSGAQMRRRLVWPVTIVALVATVAAVLVAVGSGRTTPAPTDRAPAASVYRAQAAQLGPAAPVTIGAPLSVRPLAGDFMGLSLEYRSIEEYGGRDPSAVNPLFVRLIDALSPGERPELRIGGDSTDRAWWPARGVHKPLGAYIRLNASWGAVARAVVRATDARVILGIDLEADSGASARVEATRLVSAIGRHWVQALELGNEPELYSAFTWYHVHGRKMPGRGPGWNVADYLREFSTIARSLPRLPLAGPATGSQKWMGYVGRFIAVEPRVRIVTLHRYPLQRCYVARGARIYPTIRHLLTRPSTAGLADSVARDVALAHAHGLLVRIDEVNTISCGRVPAVDESFASALWVLQTLFAFARTGVDGVNIHTYAGSPYALFKFHHHDGDWSSVVYPEYYGMRMFAQAAPPGSRLLSVTGAQQAGIQAWATRTPGGQVRVVLINARPRARTLSVDIHGGGAKATIERLLAPSLRARSGVTIGGQSFTATSAAPGVPSGRRQTEQLARRGGAYRVSVPGASAALLTIPTR